MLESGLTQLVYLARKAVNASEPLITKSSVGSAATTNSLDILGLITSLLVVLVLIVVSALILKKLNVVQ